MKIQPHYKEGGKIPQLKERAGVPYFVFPAWRNTLGSTWFLQPVGRGKLQGLFLP